MPKVLFITEKYHTGPAYGLTNNMYNLVGSYLCAGHSDYEHVFLDPEEVWSSGGVDHALLSRQYDAAVISVYHHLPSRQVARQVGHKTVMCWWDSIVSMGGVNSWAPDIHQLCFDWGKGEESPNVFCVQVPQDERVFYRDAAVAEDIDISFVGSIDDARGDRARLVSRLREAGLSVWAGGGRGPGQSNLSIEEYSSVFRRSKICLNLAWGHGRPQRKGRSFEIAACGQFMMSNCCEMFEGRGGRWFEPEVDYASFDDLNVIDRVRHFLASPEERDAAADSIYDKYRDKYSAKHFWGEVLGICGVRP